MVSTALAFAAVALLLVISPGPDFAVVTRMSAQHGWRAGVWTAAGIHTGLVLWGCATGLGIAAVVSHAPALYDGLKWAGAAYLAWIGLRALRSVVGPKAAAVEQDLELRSAYLLGLTTNLLNPKIAVFYVAAVPQFIGADRSVLAWSIAFAVIHAVLGMSWLSICALAVSRFKRVLSRPRVQRTLDAISGTVLLGFAVRLLRTSTA